MARTTKSQAEVPASDVGPGDRVEVKSRFDGHWARGFEIVSRDAEGYRVLRLSDHSELPAVFGAEEIRPERHRSGLWWY